MKKILKVFACGLAIAAGVFLLAKAISTALFVFPFTRRTMAFLSHAIWPVAFGAGFLHVYNNLLNEH